MREDHGMPIINITGERVALGPLRRDLLPTYQRWVNDFTVLRGLAIPPAPMTLEEEAAWYDHGQGANRVQFTIYERETWRPLGNTSWHEINYRHRTASFGIFIGESDARGKGYGTEATRLMLDYAFTGLGLHSVLLTVYAFNLGAQRTYEKAGFTLVGRRRQCHMMGGVLWDEIYMDCLASDFESPVLQHILTPDTPRG